MAKLRDRVAAVRNQSPGNSEEKGAAALVFGRDTPTISAYGDRSTVDEQLDILGLRNVFGDVDKRLIEPNTEEIVARNPDVIILLQGHPDPTGTSDEDHVLIQCVHRAVSGGASLLVDGYQVINRLRDTHPDLWEFLTTVDVDFYGAWNPQRGVPNTPQVCRHVEWTRAGRRVVRANQGARPVWRGRAMHEAMTEQQEAMLDLFADIRATVATTAPTTMLADGRSCSSTTAAAGTGATGTTPCLINIMSRHATRSHR